MREINGYGLFVSRALREIDETSSFSIRLPSWKHRLVGALVQNEIRTTDVGKRNFLNTLSGPMGVLQAFLYAPLSTLIRIAREAGYKVSHEDGRILNFKSPGER
jgi:hypothetical protein